eukprot:7371880-Pyramimonas_sp.AAC.1
MLAGMLGFSVLAAPKMAQETLRYRPQDLPPEAPKRAQKVPKDGPQRGTRTDIRALTLRAFRTQRSMIRASQIHTLYDHPSGDKEVVGGERGEPTSDSIDLTIGLTPRDTTGHHGTLVDLSLIHISEPTRPEPI